jgi:hypothetical protein
MPVVLNDGLTAFPVVAVPVMPVAVVPVPVVVPGTSKALGTPFPIAV